MFGVRHAEKPWKKPNVDSETPPCVRSKRPRVYRHHAHMFQHMCAWCRYGNVLNVHTGTCGVDTRVEGRERERSSSASFFIGKQVFLDIS